MQDRGAFVDHDLRLHLAIAQATKNTLYSLLTASLGEALESSIRVGMERSTSQDVEMSLQEHQDIVEAIATGDASAAEQAMRVHFDDAIRIVIGDESV
jgi:DNA-binding FadR family transcriptional regulator